MSALPLPMLEEEQELDWPTCSACGSDQHKGEVCVRCGLCQVCSEAADDCTCEVSAYDRFMEADHQEWCDLRYR